MTERLPRVFIGSSTEGRDVARALQLNLQGVCESTCWDQGIFKLSATTIEGLVSEMAGFDFAVLVMSPDDVVQVRGSESSSARDNVLVEAGLAIGLLGRDRTFIVFQDGADIKIPSDLAGVTLAGWRPYQSGDLRAALANAANLIIDAMARLKPRTGQVRPGSVFLAVPMNAFNRAGKPQDYDGFRTSVLRLMEEIETSGVSGKVFCAIANSHSIDQFDIASASLLIDVPEVRQCEYFALILLAGVNSKSILVEAGMALALNKKCLIFAQDGAELPYILRNDSALPNMRHIPFQTIDDLIAMVRRNGRQMFQFR